MFTHFASKKSTIMNVTDCEFVHIDSSTDIICVFVGAKIAKRKTKRRKFKQETIRRKKNHNNKFTFKINLNE